MFDVFEILKPDLVKRAEFRDQLYANVDEALRGIAMSVVSIMASKLDVDNQQIKIASENIYRLTVNYITLTEIARILTLSSDPDEAFYKIMQEWKALSDSEKEKGLSFKLIMSPKNRQKLLETFNQGVEATKPFIAFKESVDEMVARVEKSNLEFEEMFKDVDMDLFEKALEHSSSLARFTERLFCKPEVDVKVEKTDD